MRISILSSHSNMNRYGRNSKKKMIPPAAAATLALEKNVLIMKLLVIVASM